MDTFGGILKVLREEKGLSIRELARRSGISHSYLSQVENDKRNMPTSEKLQRLSEVLGIEYAILIGAVSYYNSNEKSSFDKKLSNDEKKLISYFDSYGETLSQSIKNSNFDLDKGLMPVTIQIPTGLTYTDNNGVRHSKAVSHGDVFDLFHLLNMNVDLYYNRFHGSKKPLTDQDKDKIKTMLKTILE